MFTFSIYMFQISVKRGRSLRSKVQNAPHDSLKVKPRSKSQYDPRKIRRIRENSDQNEIIGTADKTFSKNAGKIKGVLTNKFMQTINKLNKL